MVRLALFALARPGSWDEDRLVARVAWEHGRGRSLAEILADPGIRARCTDDQCRGLLNRPDLIRALAANFGAEAAQLRNGASAEPGGTDLAP
jgi:hypothetical protein